MSPFLIVIIALASLFFLTQIGFYIKSKKSVGNPIPFDKIDKGVVEGLRDKKGLIYFHSPTCHNCKTQTPIIEKLSKENESIISVDVSKKINTARALSVMGTPSIIMFSNNKIQNYFVGVKDEKFLSEHLAKL